MNCVTCGGSMLPDRLENDLRCLMCGRPRRRRSNTMPEKQRPVFRRNWEVDPSELLTEHGPYALEMPS